MHRGQHSRGFLILKALTVLILAGSCSLGRMDQVSLFFPKIPEGCSFDTDRAWILEYRDGSGGRARREVRFVPGGTMFLEVQKEVPLICLLYPPAHSEQFKAHPAGGLFVPGETASLEMNWPDGAGVEFLVSASSGGLDLMRINLRRLLDTIEERGAPDSWLLDWDLLGRQLAKEEMRYWYIRKKYCYELDIPFPPGSWFSRSIWLEPLNCSGEVNTVLTLPEGIHSYRNSESGQVFIVVVEDSGEFFTLLY